MHGLGKEGNVQRIIDPWRERMDFKSQWIVEDPSEEGPKTIYYVKGAPLVARHYDEDY